MSNSNDSKKHNLKILAIGCGNMGLPVIELFKNSGRILVVSPHEKKFYSKNISWQSSKDPIPSDFSPDIILCNVKPQQAYQVLPPYARYESAIFVSIMAGTKIETLQEILGGDRKIFRAMPNMLIKIKKSTTLYCHNLSDNTARPIINILSAGGKMLPIDENDFNLATAFFGCTPGLIAGLAKAMAETLQASGLVKDGQEERIITDLMKHTLHIAYKKPLAEFAKEVSSKGGMTEAGLKVLLDHEEGFHNLWSKTIIAATKRGELL